MSTDRPTKITVAHVILSLGVGGMERLVADLVCAMDTERFTPVVICLQRLGSIADDVSARGIEVMLLPRKIPVVSMLYPAQLVAALKQVGADIVHAHSGCWFKAAVAARLAGVEKVIFTEHGREFPDPKHHIILNRISSKLTGSVVTVSPQLADYMRDVVHIPSDKISVIINGINTAKFQLVRHDPQCGAVRIGVVARLEAVKDIATLVRAMKLVTAEYPAVVLEIFGDGSERPSLERLAAELGIAGNVRFHGMRRDIPEALAGLDIYALSSLSEGISVSILEAMAAGLPVAATRVGGNPFLITEGINGFLVPPASPAELANAFIRLIKDESLRLRIGAANREKAKREFDIKAVAEKYERLYLS